MRILAFDSFTELFIVVLGVPFLCLILWLVFAEEWTLWPRRGGIGEPCRASEVECDPPFRCRRAPTMEYVCGT